jgi:hypothetical protein
MEIVDMADEKCSTCGAPAQFFHRDRSEIKYACAPHAKPDWTSLSAMRGSLHRIHGRAARIHERILGPNPDKGKPEP